MLKRLSPLARFVLGLAGLLTGLALIAGIWFWFPARPRAQWQSAYEWQNLFVSPDGRTLLTIHEVGMSLWDLPEGRERAVLEVPRNQHEFRRFSNVILSPDGRHVAFLLTFDGGRNPEFHAQLWSPDVEPLPWRVPGSTLLGFTPDSQTLIASVGHLLRVDTATGKSKAVEYPTNVRQLAMSPLLPDGRVVMVGNEEKDGIWNREEWLAVTWLDYGRGGMRSVRFPGFADEDMVPVLAPDGNCAAAILGRQVKLWDLTTGNELATLAGSEAQQISPYRSACGWFSPDGRWFGVLLDPVEAERPWRRVEAVWDLHASPPRRQAAWPDDCMAFSPDGNWLLVHPAFDSDRYAILPAGTLAHHIRLKSVTRTPQFAPDSRTLAVPVLDFAPRGVTGTLLWALGLDEPARPAEDQLQIWDVAAGRPIGFLDCTPAFAFFPDGRTLAVGAVDSSIQLWDIPPRRPWWVEYGLPVLFVLWATLGLRRLWRAVRKPKEAALGEASQAVNAPGC